MMLSIQNVPIAIRPLAIREVDPFASRLVFLTGHFFLYKSLMEWGGVIFNGFCKVRRTFWVTGLDHWVPASYFVFLVISSWVEIHVLVPPPLKSQMNL